MSSTAKAKVRDFRSPSPLLRKTERRRSRSRSRQRIESDFANKIQQIPVLKATMDYIAATYGVIKDTNPLLKQSLERGEDAAFWMRSKATEVVEGSRLKYPIQRLDQAAARGMGKVEETTALMRARWDENVKNLQSMIHALSDGLNRGYERFQYGILESIQTTLDYFEENFEAVMLPVSQDAAKYAEDTTPMTTLRRMLDMTYRFHFGTVNYVFQGAKSMFDFEGWRIFVYKTLHPSQVKSRFTIVFHEMFQEEEINYVDNKELLEIDRKMISVTRPVVGTMKKVGNGFQATQEAAKQSWNYTLDLGKQFAEAKSVRDVSGIILHESQRGVDVIQSFFPSIKESPHVNNLKDWMKVKEKSL